MSIEDMLRKNREWAAGATANDPDFFTRQLGGQSPNLLWIGKRTSGTSRAKNSFG